MLRLPQPGLATLALALGACAGPPVNLATALSPTPSPRPITIPSPMATPPALPSDVPRAGAFLLHEDFERGLSRWVPEGGTGAVGWQLLNATTCGGEWTMLLGRADWRLFQGLRGEAVLRLRAPLDLRAARRPILWYDVRGEATAPEAIVLQPEVSRDGQAWQPVGKAADGRYRFVTKHHAELTAHRGAEVQLRFRAAFDVGTTATKGLLLDDIQVLEPSEVDQP
ncbi:MAG: hypothetical protein VKS61_12580 [Candidatus Sericytochromatia bacterium]|nr:hypothetical protein [Candidatus Sericytochromatia bacterium]